MPEARRAPAPGFRHLPSAGVALGWIEEGIDEIGGSGVARVQGVFVDSQSGAPTWVVAKLGRFGKSVALPVHDCAGVAGRIWVPHTRDAIRSAPSVDPEKPLAREHELAICAHYGIHEGLGRAAEVSGRPEGSITSRPPEPPSSA